MILGHTRLQLPPYLISIIIKNSFIIPKISAYNIQIFVNMMDETEMWEIIDNKIEIINLSSSQ